MTVVRRGSQCLSFNARLAQLSSHYYAKKMTCKGKTDYLDSDYCTDKEKTVFIGEQFPKIVEQLEETFLICY